MQNTPIMHKAQNKRAKTAASPLRVAFGCVFALAASLSAGAAEAGVAGLAAAGAFEAGVAGLAAAGAFGAGAAGLTAVGPSAVWVAGSG